MTFFALVYLVHGLCVIPDFPNVFSTEPIVYGAFHEYGIMRCEYL